MPYRAPGCSGSSRISARRRRCCRPATGLRRTRAPPSAPQAERVRQSGRGAGSAPWEEPGLGAAAIKAVSRFMSTMERLEERAESASVGDLLNELLHEVGYIEALQAERTIEAEGR